MTDRKSVLTAILVDSVSGPAKRIQAEVTGIGTAVSKTTAVLTGIGVGVGEAIFRGITDAIGTVVRALPNLIEQGNSYLDQLKMIQLETGMTAEQTSTLVGSIIALGAPIESLDLLFARLGKNLGANEGLFRQLGVATRDSNGNLLSAYTIFQNIRRAVQEHGESLLSTAAAQELFGRGGYQLIQALQASDPEWQAATENVRRWGGVVSQSAIDGAHALDRTLASLGQGITDIGVNIASAIDPYLRAFVDAFSRFVQAHLTEIINFAVAVANTILGFISGLFGITDALSVSADGVAAATGKASTGTAEFGKTTKAAASGVDAFTGSINRQIRAIDDHIAAMTRAAEKRRAIAERQRLATSLAAAQAQLADLRGNAPFLGGLSGAEQALAVQKHAQDIVDAEKNVADQRQAIGDFEADQKDRAERELLSRERQRLSDSLAAHKATNAGILASGLQMGAGLDKSISTVLGNLGVRSQEFGKTAAASFKTGVDAAKGFLDILFGAEQVGDIGHREGGGRTGGLIGAIGSVGGALQGLTGLFSDLFGSVRDVAAAGDWLAGVLNAVEGGFTNAGIKIHNFIRDILAAIGIGTPSQSGHGAGDEFATGGFVPATPGGRRITVAEGGEGEYIVPASKAGLFGTTLIVNLYADFLANPSDEQIRTVTDKISRRLAFSLNHSPVSSTPSGAF